MKNGKTGFAVASGIFLLLYGVGFLLLLRLGGGFDFWEDLVVFLVLPDLALAAVAGVFMLLRRPRGAALLISLAALVVLAREAMTIPEYWNPASYDGFLDSMPREYVLVPILNILAALCFAVALYLRGRPALTLSVLSAAAELASMVLSLSSAAYMVGHLTPFSVFLPFNFAMAAVFAGLWLLSRKKPPVEGKPD